ncbi:MAG: molybdopterin biosynthesis protein [Candidatus Methanomethyliaceae archaeon]|nr:molybdopterin biosynthesis protein [Candidatus Methanomethyliaceae archaeon]
MRRIFHRLMSIEEAKERILSGVKKDLGTEVVKISDAGGRTLANSIISKLDLPPFDRAEMDGFAVYSSDLEGASEQKPVELRVVGRIDAGDALLRELGRGECFEIATGAPMPKGADSVVMVEYTKKVGDHVQIFRGTTPGENVASAGSDIQMGELVLRRGTVLGKREIGLLAAIGLEEVEVVRRIKIGVLSTGDELLGQGESLQFGKIYDANAPSISTALREYGAEVINLGRARDDYEEIKTRVRDGLSICDAVILSGGTSAGAGDIVYRVLEEVCDQGIIVHGLSVKPGKPTVVALHQGKPVFGLPGYPVSALMIFNEIVRPYLESASSVRKRENAKILAKLSERVNAAKGRRWFLPVHVIKKGGHNIAYPIFASSGAIGTLAKADGYIVIPEDVEFLDEGKEVQVNLFNDEEGLAELVIIGSNCPALDLLLEMLFKRSGIRSKVVNIGSLGGLEAVSKMEADIAGIHLLDPQTMRYNEDFVRKFGLPDGSLVKGYRRLQGIILKKGNPKSIRGLEDLLRKDIMFVNRNRGSGTRILTDHMLRKICNNLGLEFEDVIKKIRGYRWEAKTHSAVAAAVYQGRADMGIGVMTAAANYGLDFIPIGYEEYDFVVSPESLNKEAVQEFLRCLKSKDFKDELLKLPGYDAYS